MIKKVLYERIPGTLTREDQPFKNLFFVEYVNIINLRIIYLVLIYSCQYNIIITKYYLQKKQIFLFKLNIYIQLRILFYYVSHHTPSFSYTCILF